METPPSRLHLVFVDDQLVQKRINVSLFFSRFLFRLTVDINFECFFCHFFSRFSWCIFSVIVFFIIMIIIFILFLFLYSRIYENKLWTQESHFFLLKRLAAKMKIKASFDNYL